MITSGSALTSEVVSPQRQKHKWSFSISFFNAPFSLPHLLEDGCFQKNKSNPIRLHELKLLTGFAVLAFQLSAKVSFFFFLTPLFVRLWLSPLLVALGYFVLKMWEDSGLSCPTAN